MWTRVLQVQENQNRVSSQKEECFLYSSGELYTKTVSEVCCSQEKNAPLAPFRPKKFNVQCKNFLKIDKKGRYRVAITKAENASFCQVIFERKFHLRLSNNKVMANLLQNVSAPHILHPSEISQEKEIKILRKTSSSKILAFFHTSRQSTR